MKSCTSASSSLYESGLLDSATGGTMRPGGLELTASVVRSCGFKPGSLILDVGCGIGTTVEFLRNSLGLDAIGVDPSEKLVRRGLERSPGLPLLQAKAEKLPFDCGTADGILFECTYSVFADRRQALAECHRVLNKSGVLAITDLYARNTVNLCEVRKHSIPCFGNVLTREAIEQELAAASFSVESWEDHTSVLKALLFRLVLTHGSLASIFDCNGSGSTDFSEFQNVVKRIKPGYFALRARKI